MNLDSSNLPPGVKVAMRRAPEIRERGDENCIANTESFGALVTTLAVKAPSTRAIANNPAQTSNPDARPIVSFFTAGHPEPQGSKKAYVPLHPTTKEPYRDKNGRIIVNVLDDNAEGKKWKNLVAYTARMVFHETPITGPLIWRFEFVVKRPQGHFGTGKNSGTVKESAPTFPITRPDCLKLCRAVEDSLTGVLWADDSQIVDQSANKRFGALEGVNVTVWHATVIATGSPTYEQLKLQPKEPEPEAELPLPGIE